MIPVIRILKFYNSSLYCVNIITICHNIQMEVEYDHKLYYYIIENDHIVLCV